MKLNRNQLAFVKAAEAKHGENALLSREDIFRLMSEQNLGQPYWLTTKSEFREGRGQYRVPSSGTYTRSVSAPKVVETQEVAPVEMSQVVTLRQPRLADESEPAIPDKFPDYVPFGFYADLKRIVKTHEFFPVFITGHSGGGKTLMVEQICAELQRECIRINITIETDESDLLGGPTLVNGNVVNRDGPVITAMKRGAVLLIDEVDRGSNKLMCLQGILEGKSYYNKKNGEVVHPAAGFTIIATANTKGQGSDEGRYLAQILDSAFLNRFIITIEQEFADIKIEKKILKSILSDEQFANDLATWADVVRRSAKQGVDIEVISTRKLVHIARTFSVFHDKMKAIKLCLSLFDENTRTSLLDLYTKVCKDDANKTDDELKLETANTNAETTDVAF